MKDLGKIFYFNREFYYYKKEITVLFWLIDLYIAEFCKKEIFRKTYYHTMLFYLLFFLSVIIVTIQNYFPKQVGFESYALGTKQEGFGGYIGPPRPCLCWYNQWNLVAMVII